MNTPTPLLDALDSTPFSLNALEHELAGYYAAMAVMLEDCFKPGAGISMLGGDAKTWASDYIELVRVRETVIGAHLPAWRDYAYKGHVSEGFSIHQLETVDGPYARLRDMLRLLNVNDGYFIDCLETVGAVVPHDKSALKDLVERTDARHQLDEGWELSIRQLAILANMNERSVRNAVTAVGSNKLEINQRGMVSSATAEQWLAGRRGFVATKKPSQQVDDKAQPPERLSSFELTFFLNSRLHEKWLDEQEMEGSALVDAANAAEMKVARLEEVCRLPFCLRPEEAAKLAIALGLDPVWLTRQVLWAIYPEQMDLVTRELSVREGRNTSDLRKEKGEPTDSVTVTLNEAMIKHGYLDLPVNASWLFPEDCFASRAPRTLLTKATQVTFNYGEHSEITDIRQKSGKTISPRIRFGAWFNHQLKAQPGDQIRVTKNAERRYSLHFIGQ